MKILFIGNSHTFFNDMPHVVADLYRLVKHETVDVTMLTIGGMSLTEHATQPQVHFNIKYGNYDAAVLQDVAHPFRGVGLLRDGLNDIIPMLNAVHAKPVLYMTWASKAAPEVQQEMADAYFACGREFDAAVSPVGLVWQKIRNEHPEIDLFYTDGEHGGAYGSYLAACVHFCTLSGYRELLPQPAASGAFYCSRSLDPEKCAAIHSAVYDIFKEYNL